MSYWIAKVFQPRTYLDNFLLEWAGKLVLLAPLGGATGSLSSDLALSKVFTELFNFGVETQWKRSILKRFLKWVSHNIFYFGQLITRSEPVSLCLLVMSDQFSPVLDIPAHALTERTLARLPCLVTESRLRTEKWAPPWPVSTLSPPAHHDYLSITS